MSLIERTDHEGILELALDRAEKLNALSPDLLDELLDAQRDATEDSNVRVIVLHGKGPTFCAGADLLYVEAMHGERARSRAYLDLLRDVIVGFERMPQPVIGALHGYVLAGGLELALGCDVLIASRDSRIGDQHMGRGFMPGGGNSQRIPRLVGLYRGMDLLLTGRWLSADEACAIGLISRVADEGEALSDARELAAELAAKSPRALREIKRLARLATSVPLADGLQTEIEAVMDYYTDPAFKEALATFTGRRGA